MKAKDKYVLIIGLMIFGLLFINLGLINKLNDYYNSYIFSTHNLTTLSTDVYNSFNGTNYSVYYIPINLGQIYFCKHKQCLNFDDSFRNSELLGLTTNDDIIYIDYDNIVNYSKEILNNSNYSNHRLQNVIVNELRNTLIHELGHILYNKNIYDYDFCKDKLNMSYDNNYNLQNTQYFIDLYNDYINVYSDDYLYRSLDFQWVYYNSTYTTQNWDDETFVRIMAYCMYKNSENSYFIWNRNNFFCDNFKNLNDIDLIYYTQNLNNIIVNRYILNKYSVY